MERNQKQLMENEIRSLLKLKGLAVLLILVLSTQELEVLGLLPLVAAYFDLLIRDNASRIAVFASHERKANHARRRRDHVPLSFEESLCLKEVRETHWWTLRSLAIRGLSVVCCAIPIMVWVSGGNVLMLASAVIGGLTSLIAELRYKAVQKRLSDSD